jgi:predicted glycosyltransferase
VRIWYDACTGKHVRYAVAVAQRFRRLGHEVILTTRKHPDTLELAKLLNEKFIVVGKYGLGSLPRKLLESTKRQLKFCQMFEKNPPDIGISHGSVELCRVAFGMGFPSICTNDTPHAEAVKRLTTPLTDYLVIPKAIPKAFFEGYGAKRIVEFDGVDEVAWVKDFKSKIEKKYEHPLIVVRQLQTMASYAKSKPDTTMILAKKLAALGNVVFLSRYSRHPKKGMIIPTELVDTVNLAAQADLVVSAGGTIAREAALQGTPSIVISTIDRFHVNDYLEKKEFPIFTFNDIPQALKSAEKNLGQKWNVKKLLEKLENPIDVIEKIALTGIENRV